MKMTNESLRNLLGRYGMTSRVRSCDASFYVVATLEPSRSRGAEGAEYRSAGAFNEARDHVLLLLFLLFLLLHLALFPLRTLLRVSIALSRFFRLRGLPSPMTVNEDYHGTGVTCSRSAGFERIAFRSGFRSAPRLSSPSRDLPGLTEVRSRFNVT